ncbi:MAG: peptidoglycan editing factor PgeF [Acidobacteriaceae bacterium]
MPTKSVPKTRVSILRADSLEEIAGLIHGFSTRTGGLSKAYGSKTLNLGFTKQDSRATVERNRGLFLKDLTGSTNAPQLITLRQLHSDLIHCVSDTAQGELAGDGLITQARGILLGIQTADCLPIILVDSKRPAVGIFHAGWRGTLKRIVEKGAGEMRRHFGTRPQDIKAAIGPGIRNCCYEVGAEMRESFESQFEYAGKLFREVEESDPVREKYPMLFLTARAPGHSELPRKIFFDLAEANLRQLRAIGVSRRNITVSPFCTACRTDLLFSHRAEKGVTGRMMAVVGIRN